jgi:hypothetical protein
MLFSFGNYSLDTDRRLRRGGDPLGDAASAAVTRSAREFKGNGATGPKQRNYAARPDAN